MTVKILRVLGGLLGLMGIVLGVALLVYPDKDGLWRHWIVPIGFLGTGWYFLGYAFTGTRAFLWFRRKSRSRFGS